MQLNPSTGDIELVFLVYFSRSGSTFFANLLAKNSTELVVMPETDIVTTLIQLDPSSLMAMSEHELTSILLSDSKINDWDVPGDFCGAVARQCLGQKAPIILKTVAAEYAKVTGQPRPKCALFQRGTILNHFESLFTAIDRPRILYLYRDPRATISSIVKISKDRFSEFSKDQMGRSDVIGLALRWQKYHRLAVDLQAKYPTIFTFTNYQDLCQETDKCLDHVFSTIRAKRSLEVSPIGAVVSDAEREIHANIDRAPDLNRLEGWKKELNTDSGMIVEALLSKQLSESGYPPYFADQHISVGRTARIWIFHGFAFLISEAKTQLMRKRSSRKS